jgi:hypothetical protein
MILYEVNLKVQKSIEKEFSSWLEQHLEDMLALNCFTKALAFTEEADSNEIVSFVAHYYLETREELDEYFSKYAEKMRADGLKKFADQFTATRRILSLTTQ